MTANAISAPLAPDMSVYLRPEAMVTPGVAGGLTMMITNTLHQVFPLLPAAGTGLLISAMFGAVVLASTVPLWQRAIFYVLNTLVVFCMAMGSANLAHDASKAQPVPHTSWLSIVSAAHAQESGDDRYVTGLKRIFADPGLSEADRERAIADLNQRAQAEHWLVPGGVPMPPRQASSGFFQQWSLQ
jgi:hypothetical protein